MIHMVKEIPLTQGKVALVDDEDYERVIQYKWYAHKIGRSWYVMTHKPKTKKFIYIHRFIMDAEPWEEVDHIDGDGLNNQRHNLRIVTHSQNLMNCKKHSDGSSGFKGVSWNKNKKNGRV